MGNHITFGSIYGGVICGTFLATEENKFRNSDQHIFSFSDSLTLQLWKDRKDCERNPPSKGSLSLQEYLGWEAGFTLEKESHTLALILKEDVIIFAFDNRESLMRWQVS